MPDLVALVPRYSVTCPHYHIVVSPFSYARPLGPKCIPRYLLALLEVCRYIHYQKRNSPVPTPRPRKPNRPTAGSHPQNALRALHSPLPRCEASQEFSEKKPTRNIKKLPPKKTNPCRYSSRPPGSRQISTVLHAKRGSAKKLCHWSSLREKL